MAKDYKAWNAPMPTTAALAPVGTGTAIKTLLQIATPATEDITVIAWGISFDGFAAAAPIKVELIETDVAATVTAHTSTGIIKVNAPNDPGSLVTLGTAATGYTATAEGTITATRVLDCQFVAPTNQNFIQLPLGREWKVAASKFLRIRVTAAAAVNAYCWIEWEE